MLTKGKHFLFTIYQTIIEVLQFSYCTSIVTPTVWILNGTRKPKNLRFKKLGDEVPQRIRSESFLIHRITVFVQENISETGSRRLAQV